MTWRSSNYSSSDIMSMQQDAIRRVREMQRISNSKVGGDESKSTAYIPAPPVRKEEKRPQGATSVPKNQNFIQDLLSKLNLDHDRLIILLLLVVLLNEGADSKLLLALCYLLL